MANTAGACTAEQIREKLARCLGFDDYPENKLAEPYLNYIENRYTGAGTFEGYLNLFCDVVEHFTRVGSPQGSVQSFIDTLCSSRTEPLFADTQEQEPRTELVADTVLYILGAWIAALSYFIKVGGCRQVELAYCVKQGKDASRGSDVAREATLPDMLKGSGLFVSPDEALEFRTSLSSSTSRPLAATSSTQSDLQLIHYSQIDSLESVSIKSTRLNAYALSSLADTRICWTLNLSRHLLLTKIRGQYVVEVFALPCMLKGSSTLVKAGVPASLIHEIQESYSIFFNPFGSNSVHKRMGSVIGLSHWCWCRSCASLRLRYREIKSLKGKVTAASRRRAGNRAKSEFDPLLEILMESIEREDWCYALFPHLWLRILVLEEHLLAAKPWNFWVLFRDRRDTLQFWTFFFGTVILFMTFLQVALGAAQVAVAFKPSSPSTGR